MALEPHRNTDFKTGAGIEKRTKNASYGQKTEPDLKSKSLSFLSHTCKNIGDLVISRISEFQFFEV